MILKRIGDHDTLRKLNTREIATTIVPTKKQQLTPTVDALIIIRNPYDWVTEISDGDLQKNLRIVGKPTKEQPVLRQAKETLYIQLLDSYPRRVCTVVIVVFFC